MLGTSDSSSMAVEGAARKLGKTPEQLENIRLSLAGKSRHEREEIIRRALVDAGILRDRPPIQIDLTTYKEFEPIRISGKPVSETVIEERR